jgi:hypothetical protein
MGLDLGYAMMDGALNLAVSYNTASDGTTDQDMTSLGATYNVNESMSISATQSTYGENAFAGGGNYGAYGTDSWMSHGNMGYLGDNQKDLAIGGTYAMGDFNLGVTMHTVTNDEDDTYERSATDISIGYTMSANAGLAVKYVTDNNGTDTDTKYTWLTLTITP